MTVSSNSPARGTVRRRLWLGGLALGVFIATACIANRFVAPERALAAGDLGLDCTAFYTAGTFVREGRIEALYDLDAIRAFQQDLSARHGLNLNGSIGPWWNPPFYAWVFAPLSRLEFPAALRVWMLINAACVAIASLLLGRMLVADVLRTWRVAGDNDDDLAEPVAPRPDTSWRTWGLIPLLVMVSMPFVGVIGHGQNGGTSLLLLTLIVMAWRSERAVLAGLLCGPLFYKPQLAAVVAVALTLSLGRRALVGLACGGIALAMVTLLTLPGALGDFLTRMPANLQRAQETLPYLWERHVTMLAFWRLLIQGREIGPTGVPATLMAIQCALLLGGVLAFAALRARRPAGMADGLCALDQELLPQLRLDRLIAATLVTMPLIMPFYFDYDLILLAIPATLMAREHLVLRARGVETAGPAALRLWTALYVCLMISAPLAAATRVNLAVPLLAMLSVLGLAKNWRRVELPRPAIQVVRVTPVPVRRAA